jgi:phosphoglycolate phosphatase-like HAD superfamily hydrolase
MKYEIGMYDWNGTVADDPHTCHECVVEIFRTFGPGIPIPDFEEWRSDHGAANFLDFYYQRGIERSVTIGMIREAWIPHYKKQMLARDAYIREGVKDVLEFCREHGARNIIVSSSVDDVEYYLKMAKLRHLFDEVHIGVSNKNAALTEVVERYNIDPAKGFYIDDTFDGVSHANEVGLTTFGVVIGCQDENRVRAANPNYSVSSFREIHRVLQYT